VVLGSVLLKFDRVTGDCQTLDNFVALCSAERVAGQDVSWRQIRCCVSAAEFEFSITDAWLISVSQAAFTRCAACSNFAFYYSFPLNLRRSLAKLEQDMKLLPPYSITLLLPAFHPVLDVVVLGRVIFDFRAGGEVVVGHESLVSSTGMYKSTSDFVRAGFEGLLLLWTTVQLARELRDMWNGGALQYLQNMFNWLDLGSIAAVYFGACLCVLVASGFTALYVFSFCACPDTQAS
jgi:hypothetical protein